MTRLQLSLCGLVAATVSGAWCALGWLLVAAVLDGWRMGAVEPDGGWPAFIVWSAIVGCVGAAAGVGAGVVPTVLAVLRWPRWLARWGVGRAIDAVTVLVFAVAWVETFVLALGLDDPGEAFWWALGAAGVAGVVARTVLRLEWRRHLRRTLRGVAR